MEPHGQARGTFQYARGAESLPAGRQAEREPRPRPGRESKGENGCGLRHLCVGNGHDLVSLVGLVCLVVCSASSFNRLRVKSIPKTVRFILFTTKGPARQSRNQSSNRYFTAEAQSSQSWEYFSIKNSLLRALSGHEKKLKNDEIRKIGINKIKYLQVLILAKIDFFSRPAPPRCNLRVLALR